MLKLAPSILAADFANLGDNIMQVENAGADYLHIDVMDGSFVPSISFGSPVISSIRKMSKLPFDVHLMVNEPIRFVEDYKLAGADILTVHVEACKHLNRTITKIKEMGMRAGISFNPTTPLSVLDYCLEDIDMVLIMSVNPGFGGQSYLPFITDKIRDVRNLIDRKGKKIDIQVDGGISCANVSQIIDAGANVIVAGSAVFGGDITRNVNGFKEIFAAAQK